VRARQSMPLALASVDSDVGEKGGDASSYAVTIREGVRRGHSGWPVTPVMHVVHQRDVHSFRRLHDGADAVAHPPRP
jgi:hypothetical protein